MPKHMTNRIGKGFLSVNYVVIAIKCSETFWPQEGLLQSQGTKNNSILYLATEEGPFGAEKLCYI